MAALIPVTVNVTHAYRGDLQFILTSPTGAQSVLGTIRNDSGNNYTNWTFTTVKDWGEYAAGTWTLQVRDGISSDAGIFVDWSLAIYGTAASPMPQVSQITRPAAEQVQLRFPTLNGTAYQVFQSATLAADSWQPVGAKFTATGNETLRDVTVSPTAGSMFFRVAPVH